jgi:HEAT repeat protein
LEPRVLRRSHRPAAAAEFVALLGGLSDEELLALDLRARPWWWAHGSREQGLLQAALASPEPVVGRAAAAAAAMSPDGYLREAAVRQLGGELPWSFPLLALRATDWVAEVRGAAQAALESAETGCLVEHLPLLEGLCGSRGRGGDLSDWLERRMAGEEAVEDLREARHHADVGIRRAAWRRLAQQRPELVTEEIEQALSDRDVAIRLWAARRLEDLGRERLVSLAPTLLGDPVGRIRAVGLSITLDVASEEHDRLAEGSLGNRSLAVRRVAQSYLSARSYDLSGLYTGLLSERVSPARVLGLAEVGGREALPQLEALLEHDRPSVRRAAMRALGMVAPEQAPRLAIQCISDESESLARDALRILAGRAAPTAITPHIAAAGTGDPRPSVRITALGAMKRSRWRALALALAQLADPDENVRTHAKQVLGIWLTESAHAYYAPTEEQRFLVESHLANAPRNQRDAIEFVLRTAQER